MCIILYYGHTRIILYSDKNNEENIGRERNRE